MVKKKQVKTPWKKVLKEIYNYSPNLYGEGKEMQLSNNKHLLAKKLKISDKDNEISRAIEFLTDQNFIKRNLGDQSSLGYFEITEKGVETAQGIEKYEGNMFQGSAIVLFTFVLAISSIYTIFYQFQEKGTFFFGIYIGIILVIFLVILGQYKKIKM